jgi:Flp pilus assembly protein TadD
VADSLLRTRFAPLRSGLERLSAGLAVVALVAGCTSLRAANLYRDGTDALRRGDDAAAIEALERSSALVADASPIHNHLGLAYASLGQRERALREFETAVELDCTNEAAGRNLASARAGEWQALGEAPRRPVSHSPSGGNR